MSKRVFCKVLLVAVAVFVLSFLSSVLTAQGRSQEAFERVREVQERNTNRLLAIKEVVGTAVGLNENDELVVKVLLERPGVAGIPKKLDEVPVQTVVTGKIYALPKPDKPGKSGDKKKINPMKRCDRPVPIGVSTGNEEECSSGTIGCRVTDGTDVYALSNNHVYALCNEASPDSNVMQPGTYDAKPRCAVRAKDIIGTLYDFEPIDFSGANNTIDAAIALSSTANLGNATPPGGYLTPKSVPVEAVVSQPVQKYGRTTSLTKGAITGINATVVVGYADGMEARFVDQIIVQSPVRFIGAGDSGSLLVTDPDKNPVGLLFAGNAFGTYAVANRIDLVLECFDVAIDGE